MQYIIPGVDKVLTKVKYNKMLIIRVLFGVLDLSKKHYLTLIATYLTIDMCSEEIGMQKK